MIERLIDEAILVKEHGLMLSDPMVVARHERRKTQTRRLIGPSNTYVDGRRVSPKAWKERAYNMATAWVDEGPSPAGNTGPYLKAESFGAQSDGMVSRLYPIYHPGDLIWWKECHKLMHTDDLRPYPELNDGRPFDEGAPRMEEFHLRVPIYRATDPDIDLAYFNEEDEEERKVPWTPSMLMPRRWARYVDAVTACRPERLGQVSHADAEAEGVVWNEKLSLWTVPGLPVTGISPRGCYLKLMEHLHGDEILENDPWVWVITYRFGI